MKNDIDEILKQQFSDFSPDAPNVWSGIEQGLASGASATASATSASSVTVTIAAKAGFFTTKIIAVITSVVVVAGAVATYIYVKSDASASSATETTAVIETQQEIQPNIIVPQEEIQTNRNDILENSASENTEKRNQKHEAHKPKHVSENKTNNAASENVQQRVTPAPVERKQETTTERKAENATEKQPTPPSSTVTPLYSQTQQEDELLISEYAEMVKLKIPNVFTPNGDGIHDNFEIQIENEELYHLTVFDRNEKLVFESNSKDKLWDGLNQQTGEKCEEGYYVLIFRYKMKGVEYSKSGKLQLLR